MNRFRTITWSLLFICLLALIALAARRWQRPRETCAYDGTSVQPITRVELTMADKKKLVFCSTCCAHAWLRHHPDFAKKLDQGQGSLLVVDEVSGQQLDSSLAYWVESDLFSRPENRCRVHVFKDKEAAARHLLAHHGRERRGYLAGRGRKLSWAKDFLARNLEGKAIHLHDFQGKIVFIRFWSSENPFYRKDLRQLQQAYARFSRHGFVVLAIDVEEVPAKVVSAIAGLGLTYPVLLDPNGTIADSYGVTGYPTGYLLDRAGIVEKSVVGEITAELMQPLIAPFW